MRWRARSPQKYLLSKQRGFSMLELLITLVIFSIGFLGIASLQIQGLRMVRDAELTGRANLLVLSLADKLKAQGGVVSLSSWQEQVERDLPMGKGSLEQTNLFYVIAIEWTESQDSTAENARKKHQLEFAL